MVTGSTATATDLPAAFGAFDNITRTPARLPNAIGFANIGQKGLSLEPTIYLDQMKRYLDHLHELRRINEGDDTADSPGYSLNLVRIPVSVLPGKCTEIGHGAEVSMTLTPHLSDELLPTTFRNLIVNDLVDQIAYPVTQFINNPDNSIYFDDARSGDLTLDIGELFRFGDYNLGEMLYVMEKTLSEEPADSLLVFHRQGPRCRLMWTPEASRQRPAWN